MNNFNSKSIIILLSFFSLAVAFIPSEEREAIYRKHGCKEGKECEVIEIKLSRRQKRSANYSTISFPLKALGHEKMINLRQSFSGVLVGPNTPVYFARSTTLSINIEKKHGLFGSNMRYQLYQDKENLAAFTLDTNSKKLQIKSGFLVLENLIITKLSNTDYENQYLVKTMGNYTLNTISDYMNLTLIPSGNHTNKSIPDIIYPEILVIVDYELYLNFQEPELLSYLLQFWNGVNLYFSTLKNPQYQLSIAGVIIPQDEEVFDFMNPTTSFNTNQQIVNYESALYNMDSWLMVVNWFIPYSSYDTYILMTPKRDGIVEETTTGGLSAMYSACSGVLANDPHGGIVFEESNYRGILTAAHELGHIFGVDHDNSSLCAQNSIMAEKESPTQKTWSECSIQKFHKALQKEDFSCMYDKPDLGDDEILVTTKDLDKSVNDSEVLVITPAMYNHNKLIVVSHKKNFIKVRQINRDTDDENLGYKDLHVSIPDRTSLIFDPRMINSTKMIIINHIKDKIHIDTVDL